MIRNETSLQIARPASEVFAFIDDESKTSRWLELCVSLRRVSDGPKGVGTHLHYVHREGGRNGEMQGVVTDYEPNRRLGMRYTDPMFDVLVDFWLAGENGGTALRHATEITPKTFMGRIMGPLIGLAMRRQMRKDTRTLRALVEAGG